MIITERMYREGFLDGMRYSGHLLVDVPDDNLNLTTECEYAINKGFRQRGYFKDGETDITKLHAFVRRLVLDCDRLYEENEKLRGVDKSEAKLGAGL